MSEFGPGSVHKATVTFSNPKSAGFDFEASLCMGVAWAEMASASFHLDAGQSRAVEFPVTMPSIMGTYPVYFKVSSGGVLIGTFVATETVVIAGVADIKVENLVIEPSEVDVGQKVTISVTAKNYGAAAGTKTIV
ncbi:unnamed protein product, partial [marine sediment metagenome]